MQHPEWQELNSLRDAHMAAHLESFSSQPAQQTGRNRTHSEMSGARYPGGSPYVPARNPGDAWSTEAQPQLMYNTDGLAPPLPEDLSIWRQGLSDDRRDDLTMQYEHALREPDTSALIEWDENVIDE